MRSLSNTKHFAQLQLFLKTLSFKPSVIGITESHLRDNEKGPICNLEHYEYVPNCRKLYGGGGVGIYVSDDIQDYTIRDDLTIMVDKVFESVFIEIPCKEQTIL